MTRANPYQRNGAWFFEVGPFASQCDALCDLLGRVAQYEQQRAADDDQNESPAPTGGNVIAFKPRAPQP